MKKNQAELYLLKKDDCSFKWIWLCTLYPATLKEHSEFININLCVKMIWLRYHIEGSLTKDQHVYFVPWLEDGIY